MTTNPDRQRLDVLLVKRGIARTRSQAQASIAAGLVRVDHQVVTRSGQLVGEDAEIEQLGEVHPFVSRGGVKLAAALDAFDLDVTGAIAADVGASTGGFTDCLLQRGARQVYAIDVGHGQLDLGLRADKRVVVMEKTNVRSLETLPEPVDLVTVDVSFISLRLVLPVIANWLSQSGRIVALFKPQFEAGREIMARNKGVIVDAGLHRKLLSDFRHFLGENAFELVGELPSPIRGDRGNREFLLLLRRVGRVD